MWSNSDVRAMIGYWAKSVSHALKPTTGKHSFLRCCFQMLRKVILPLPQDASIDIVYGVSRFCSRLVSNRMGCFRSSRS